MGVLSVFNWEGLSVSPGGSIFDELPTWTRLDNQGGGLRLHEVQIDRGRQDEFETHETGTLSAHFHDRDGSVDPTSVDWISRPFAFAARNPVTDTWHPRFRGAIDDHHYDLHQSAIKGDVVIEAVDALDYLANFELAPGLTGDTPPSEVAGMVFYEDTTVTGPQIRINQVLADANWNPGLQSIFTGNVNLLETSYSPGEAILQVCRDAADAELPGIGQFFVDKYGVICFHGRNARFDPVATAATATHWDFNQWTAGLGTGGDVRISAPFSSTRSRRLIRNAAMSYPQDLNQRDRQDQVATDAGSITTHGIRSWSAENLITKDGITSGFTGARECLSFANYIKNNYADPVTRIDQITFKALRPEDVRGPDLWDFLTQVDISDQITVTRAHPGGGGFSADVYFVEGISETWRPMVKDLDTGYPFVEMSLDLSPATLWTTEPD